MSVPVKHHYVQRRYLRPWADGKTIWTLFKNEDRIQKVGLMDVAQQKFFYRLIDLQPGEEDFIRRFIETQCHPTLRELNHDFVTLFTSTSKLKAGLQTSTIHDKEKYATEIRDLEVRLMEDAHGKAEGLGEKLLAVASFSDFNNLSVDDAHWDAILYLCVQYFRTNKMRKNVLRSFEGKGHEQFVKNSWNIFAYIQATVLWRNISLDANLRLTYYTNSTESIFITNDQPIFNLLGEILDEKGDVAGLEFFYPLGPKSAIKIHFDTKQTERFNAIDLDRSEVDEFNRAMYRNADFFVFGASEDHLKAFTN